MYKHLKNTTILVIPLLFLYLLLLGNEYRNLWDCKAINIYRGKTIMQSEVDSIRYHINGIFGEGLKDISKSASKSLVLHLNAENYTTIYQVRIDPLLKNFTNDIFSKNISSSSLIIEEIYGLKKIYENYQCSRGISGSMWTYLFGSTLLLIFLYGYVIIKKRRDR